MNTFRYSAISCAYRCYKKFELDYVLGKKVMIQDPNMEFGTAMHLFFSTYLETMNEQEARDAFAMYWGTCKNIDFKYDSWDALNAKADIFMTRWLRLHSKKYTPKYIEHNMNFLVGDFKFQGTPDFIGEYKGVPSIVDYKTSFAKYDKRKIIVNEQMPLYAHAAEQVLGYKAEQIVYVVLVKNPEPSIQEIILPISRKDIDESLKNVITMCRDLSSRKEFPMNRDNCLKCEHYGRNCYNGQT